MRLVKCVGSNQCRCVVCGKWFKLDDLYADLDGQAFIAYYCEQDKPTAESKAKKPLTKKLD